MPLSLFSTLSWVPYNVDVSDCFSIFSFWDLLMPMIEPLMLSLKLSSFKEKFFIFPLLFSWGHFHCPVFQVTDTLSYRLVCGFPLVYFSTQLYSSALWVLLQLNIFSLLSFSCVCLFIISQVWWAFWWPWLWLLYQINCLHLSHSVFFWGSILFLQLKHVPLLPHFAWLFVSVYYANQLWLPVLKEWLCVGDELYCLTFS